MQNCEPIRREYEDFEAIARSATNASKLAAARVVMKAVYGGIVAVAEGGRLRFSAFSFGLPYGILTASAATLATVGGLPMATAAAITAST
jgi:hypothetical protein